MTTIRIFQRKTDTMYSNPREYRINHILLSAAQAERRNKLLQVALAVAGSLLIPLACLAAFTLVKLAAL